MNERTKELKSNDLATWIETRMVDVGKYVKPILTVLAVLLVVILTVIAIRAQRERAAGAGWADYMKAGGDVAALRAVAKSHKGSDVGLWALTTRGANELQSASAEMHYDRDEAREAIDSAIADLEQVVEQTQNKKSALVRAHALFSLAQAHELKFDVDKAKHYYSLLETEGVKAAPTLAALSAERSKLLDNEETQQFYTWYASQSAPRPGMSTPPGMVPPVSDADLPRDLTSLPDFPDLSVPKAPPLPDVNPEAPAPPAPEVPSPEPPAPKASETPESETPESETPESETPKPPVESPESETPETAEPDSDDKADEKANAAKK